MLNWFKSILRFNNQPQQSVDTQLRQTSQIGSRQAGVKVDPQSALTLTPVYAAVRVISETLSTLPLPVYQSLPDGGKQRERSHPLSDILNLSPDGTISAVSWREAAMGHVLTHGNSYSEIEFSRSGDVIGLHLIDPKKVRPERKSDGRLVYNVTGSAVPIPSENCLHWAGLGYDGIQGYSPVKMAARAIGLGLATEAFGSAWFGNGSRGAGVITHPGTLSPEAAQQLRDSIADVHGGPDNFGKWMIFEEGMTITPTSIPPEDAQFLQTRQFQISEIARMYRVPPHMIGDLSHATFSNIEQQSIDFVTNSIRPWCVRLEAEINRKLFSEADRDQGYFAEFLVDGLLRGDTAARYSAYAIGRQWGWLCVDDIREMENMNPLPDGMGKIYLSPLNMANTADLIEDDAADESPDSTEAAGEVPAVAPSEATDSTAVAPAPEAVEASLACLQDNLERMIRRESEAVRNAAQKPQDFLRLLDHFYSGHRTICQRAINPSLTAFNTLTGRQIALNRLCDDLGTGQAELLELSGNVSGDQLPAAIDAWLAKRDTRSHEILATLAT